MRTGSILKHLFLSGLILSSLSSFAETTLPDGKRAILNHRDGTVEAFAMDEIKDIQFVELDNAVVSLNIIAVDDASISVQTAMGSDCRRYEAACFPSSQSIEEEELANFIMANATLSGAKDMELKFIDLRPSTSYNVAVLAYDEYDFPCDITTLTVTTSEPSSTTEEPVIGGYLYADGTWSRELKSNRTPIGIIFSTEPAFSDREAGFTHGYAMAFKEADTCAWTLSADEYESGTFITSENDADITDREGRAHTSILMTQPDNHPAAKAATEYAEAPAGTSGWFLPASGQMLDIFKNLGGLGEDSLQRNNGVFGCGAEEAASALAQVDAMLETIGKGNFDPVSIYNWTSSERSVMSAYYIYCHPSMGLMLQTYYKDSKFAVRPIIAF